MDNRDWEYETNKKNHDEINERELDKIFAACEMSASATAIIKIDGTYINVNERFCQSTDYKKEELIGRTREKIGLWNKEDEQRLVEELKRYGQINNFEIWLHRKDGTEVFSLISARIITTKNESYILLVIQDASEYNKIIKQLKSSEEKFLQMFDLSTDAIVISELDGTYVEVNQAFLRMSGFSAEEVIGKNAIDLGLWLNQSDREKMVIEQQKHGEIHGLELPFQHKDGHILHGQLSVGKFELSGNPCYMIIIHDITKQKQADKLRQQQKSALMDIRNKLSVAAGLGSLGPWEYTPSTELFKFSNEFYYIYATNVANEGSYMTFEEYLNKFVYPDDAWMLQDEKNILSSGEQVDDIVHRIVRSDGEIRTVMVRRTAVKDDAGEVIKIYGTNQDITDRVKIEEERIKQEKEIAHMAYYDSLTNLANRHHLNEWLNSEMERSRKGESYGAVLFIDLDDLKLVNDTYGHKYGDTIIVEAALRIINVLDNEFFIARVGGDEFVVILSGVKEHSKIENIVQSIRGALGRTLELFGMQFGISASIGIATYPNDGNTVEEIIKNADNAMYAAKRSGKNCWRFYIETMQQEVYKEMRMTNSLRYALDENEIYLVYQPQFDTTGKNILGLEALLRWNSKEHGNVSPLQFIPLAEQSGLIHDIGQWVLCEACCFARRLGDKGLDNIRVAVNISAKQIANDDFIFIVQKAIEEAAIEPNQLELEITESSLMTSLEDAIDKLIQLKNLGVHLSLDDFGTGFSSLTYLLNLPVETLKIDKSFIDMITTDIQGAKIISSIINMAHTINMIVLAEGVETECQLAYLTDNGCDCIQGYLFSPPISEAEVIRLLSI